MTTKSIINVIQIGDIHIRPTKFTYDRVKYAAQQLRNVIEANDISVVAITGDTFDSKTKCHDSDINCFVEMCDILGRPIVIIAGNHDSEYVADVINSLRRPDITFLSPGTVMSLHGINWFVMSATSLVMHTDTTIYDESNIVNDQPNVVLSHVSHGRISGCNALKSLAEKFDAIMLGDRHKPFGRTVKYNSQNGSDESSDVVACGDKPKLVVKQYDRIHYAGSFVRRDCDENWDHGAVIWAFGKNREYSCELKPLKEILTRHKFVIVNDAFDSSISLLDMYDSIHKIYVLYIETNSENVARWRNYLLDKLDSRSKFVKVKETFDNSHAYIPLLIRSSKMATMERLLEKSIPNAAHVDKIMTIVRQTATKPTITKKLRIKWIKWSNFTCYGPDNYINFDNIQDSLIINGPNGVGKSTIFDVLSFVFKQNGGGNSHIGRFNKIADISHGEPVTVECCVVENDKTLIIVHKYSISHTCHIYEQLSVSGGMDSAQLPKFIRKPVNRPDLLIGKLDDIIFNASSLRAAKEAYTNYYEDDNVRQTRSIMGNDCAKTTLQAEIKHVELANMKNELDNKRIELFNLKNESTCAALDARNAENSIDDLDDDIEDIEEYDVIIEDEIDVELSTIEHDTIDIEYDEEVTVSNGASIIDIYPLLTDEFLMNVALSTNTSVEHIRNICTTIMRTQIANVQSVGVKKQIVKRTRQEIVEREVIKVVKQKVQRTEKQTRVVVESSNKTTQRNIITDALDRFDNINKKINDVEQELVDLQVKYDALVNSVQLSKDIMQSYEMSASLAKDKYDALLLKWHLSTINDLLSKSFTNMQFSITSAPNSATNINVLINGIKVDYCSEFQQKIFNLVMRILTPDASVNLLVSDCILGDDDEHKIELNKFLTKLSKIINTRKIILLQAGNQTSYFNVATITVAETGRSQLRFGDLPSTNFTIDTVASVVAPATVDNTIDASQVNTASAVTTVRPNKSKGSNKCPYCDDHYFVQKGAMYRKHITSKHPGRPIDA